MREPQRFIVLLAGICALAMSQLVPAAQISPASAEAQSDLRLSPQHPRVYLNAANRDRLKKALAASAPEAIRFKRVIDSAAAGANIYGFSAHFAALMYQLTGEERYARLAIEMVDKDVAAAEKAIAAGQKPAISGDSYLYVGPGIRSLALTYDWCYDRLTDQQKQRWLKYANQAVWNVWHHPQAHWGELKAPWSGWSVNNPGNNYYYSFLTATVMLGLASHGENPQAADWLAMSRDKVANQVLPYFKDLEGGGSREGTGYGVSQRELFAIFDIWKASTGQDIAPGLAHPRDSIFSMIHSTVPTMDRIAPVGDHARESSAALFDYHRGYLLVAARLAGDPQAAGLVRYYLEHCSVPRMRNDFMCIDDFVYGLGDAQAVELSQLDPVYYASGTGQCYARSSWQADATWLHFICGPYVESHAHRDQGSFLLYKRQWLAFDENILTHSGIEQGEMHHNLLRFEKDGKTVQMAYGTASKLLALQSENDFVYFAGDTSDAYKGSEPRSDNSARIKSVIRQMVFIKPDCLVVFDRGQTAAGIERIWQLNTPIKPMISDGGKGPIRLADKSKLTLVPLDDSVSAKLVDWTATDAKEYLGGWRIELTDRSPAEDFSLLNVIHLDDAAEGISPLSAAQQRGAQIKLKDGRQVKVLFNISGAVGGSIRIDRAGQNIFDAALSTQVTNPTLFGQ